MVKGSTKSKTPKNGSPNEVTQCINEPWLIEPEDTQLHFLYLKTPGFRLNNRNIDECPTKNRIVIYPAMNSYYKTVVCPTESNNSIYKNEGQRIVDLISDGWNFSSTVWHSGKPLTEHEQHHSRSFVVEFLQHEPGYYVVTWMAISKRLLSGPTILECPYRYVNFFLLK